MNPSTNPPSNHITTPTEDEEHLTGGPDQTLIAEINSLTDLVPDTGPIPPVTAAEINRRVAQIWQDNAGAGEHTRQVIPELRATIGGAGTGNGGGSREGGRRGAVSGPSSGESEHGRGGRGRGWRGGLARDRVGRGIGRGSARGQSPITGLWRGGGDFVVTGLGRGRGRGRGWGQEMPETHPWPRLHEQVPEPTTRMLERIEDPTQSDDESSTEIRLEEDVVYLPVDVGSAFPGRRVCPRRLCESDQDGWEREEDAEDMAELNEALGMRVQLTQQAREELEEVPGLRVPADGVLHVARDGSGSS